RAWRYHRQSAQPTAAFDKHFVRLSTRHDWADNSGSADDRIANETAGRPWATGRQPTSAAFNVGRKRGYVHEPENQRLAGMRSFAALRCFRPADFCALTKEPSRQRTPACILTPVFASRQRPAVVQRL